MKIRFTLAALFASILLAATAHAAPNFTGVWKLNLAKSDYGPIQQYAPEFMTRTIKHQEPSLQILTHQKGAAGEVTTDLVYTTDGKPAENKGSKGSARWDGEKLVVESVRDVNGTEIRSRDSWTLSADGQTLTVNSHLVAPQGEFELTLVFDKQ